MYVYDLSRKTRKTGKTTTARVRPVHHTANRTKKRYGTLRTAMRDDNRRVRECRNHEVRVRAFPAVRAPTSVIMTIPRSRRIHGTTRRRHAAKRRRLSTGLTRARATTTLEIRRLRVRKTVHHTGVGSVRYKL